jgi:hypothetical protein
LVGVWLRIAGEANVSVAMMSPYEFSRLMLQSARAMRQGWRLAQAPSY